MAARSIREIRKSKPKMGRPVTTGIGVPVLLRMHDPQLAALMPGSPGRQEG